MTHRTTHKPQLEGEIKIATEAEMDAIIDLQEHWRKNLGRLTRMAHGDHIRRGDTFLVRHNGQEAGYVIAHCGRNSNTHVLQVAVHNDLLKSTLGTQLMAAIRAHALRNHQLSIQLRSRIDLPANMVWPTMGYYFAGQATTRTRTRSILNTWVCPLTSPVYVPDAVRNRRCTRPHPDTQRPDAADESATVPHNIDS